MTSSKKMPCPLCGEKQYYRDTRSITLEYKDQKLTIEQPGFWCDACGEGVVEGDDQKATREVLQEFRAKIDGLLTPSQIYRIRKKVLRLTQAEAAELFGGGPNAFSRYENGEIAPSKALSSLLKILEKHPEQLAEIDRPSAA